MVKTPRVDAAGALGSPSSSTVPDGKPHVVVEYRQYQDENDLPFVMDLIDNELSEPYSIFTYRYFLHSWPSLCFLAFHGNHCFGTIVCKLEMHGALMRGYIAMLVVQKDYRGLGIGKELVKKSVEEMINGHADEVVLEAEITNVGALRLYEGLGFLRDKRLIKYYMNGNDAFRLKLLLPLDQERLQEMDAPPAIQALTLEEQTGRSTEHNRLEAQPAPDSSGNDEDLQKAADGLMGLGTPPQLPAQSKVPDSTKETTTGRARTRPNKSKGKKGRKR